MIKRWIILEAPNELFSKIAVEAGILLGKTDLVLCCWQDRIHLLGDLF